MKYLIPTLKREIERMVSRPLYLLMLIVLPLLSFSIFWLMFSEGVPKNLPVAVFDQDKSSFSRQAVRMINATSSIEIKHRVTSLEEGKQLLLSGKSYALIMIPKNLEKEVLSGFSPSIVNFYNNEFLLAGSMISRDINSVVTTLSKSFNVSIRLRKGEMPAAALNNIEPVRIISHTLFNPYLNYFYFLSGTLQPTLLQIFIITMTIFALGSELKDGTAGSLLESSNQSILFALLGKLLPYTLIYSLLGIFMNTFLFMFFKAPVAGSLGLILVSTIIFVLAYQAIGLFILALTANLRMSLSMAGFYSAPAFAFVGVTFPLMGMPLLAKIWSYLLPLTYYIKIFIDQSMKGAPINVSLPQLSIMFCFLIFIPLSIPRLSKILKNSEYWGRS